MADLRFARHRVEPVGSLDGAANTEIRRRQHIRATQLTQQEHVCGPGTDPTNRGQLSMCLVVCQLAQPVKIEATVECAHRQVPQRRSLGGRQANRAELGIGSTDDGDSRLTVADEILQTPEDRSAISSRAVMMPHE